MTLQAGGFASREGDLLPTARQAVYQVMREFEVPPLCAAEAALVLPKMAAFQHSVSLNLLRQSIRHVSTCIDLTGVTEMMS